MSPKIKKNYVNRNLHLPVGLKYITCIQVKTINELQKSVLEKNAAIKNSHHRIKFDEPSFFYK